MKASELKGMSDDQLVITLRDTEKHLFQLRFQSATDRLETPSEIRKARKDIARIRTIQRQRELTKLAQVPDEQLAKQLADLQTKTEGPGKRRVKRNLARLTAIQTSRPKTPGQSQPKPQQPAAQPKGK